MATEIKQPVNQGDSTPTHVAPVLTDGKHKPTGLKEAALQDWNRRLIVNTERPHNGGR